MISKATMWDTNLQLTKAISCDWEEERGQMSMTVQSFEGDVDVAYWNHEKLAQAIKDNQIKWGNADSIVEWYRHNDILVELPCLHKHQVICGNIGTVRSTYFYCQAEVAFESYTDENLEGRGKGEQVTWMYDGEILKEHNPLGFAGKLASILTDSSFGEEPVIMVVVKLRDGTKVVATPYTAMVADVNYPHVTILADEVENFGEAGE
jgi:hypothetical protein